MTSKNHKMEPAIIVHGGAWNIPEDEHKIRIQLARTAVEIVKALHATSIEQDPIFAKRAAQTAIDTLATRVGGHGGLIMIDRFGQVGFAYNTPHMAIAFLSEGMPEPIASI